MDIPKLGTANANRRPLAHPLLKAQGRCEDVGFGQAALIGDLRATIW
jgi:hypothetical protein